MSEEIKCPNCGCDTMVVRVTSYLTYQCENGQLFRTDEDTGDWDNESLAECPECEHEFPVSEFLASQKP